MLKRAFDLAVAIFGLTIWAPALLVVGLLVKLDSPGPVFYRGQRVGKDGRLFRIFRIRTMVEGADRQGPPLAADDDPRITRIGRFLRRTRLDEIPVLINVLKGEMSLVGPAPEHPAYVVLYSLEQRQILSVRPGLASLSALAFSDEEQILAFGRGTAAYPEAILPVKVDLDLQYVRRRSFWYDLVILARTMSLLFPRQLVRFRRLSGALRRGVPWALIDIVVVAAAFYAAVLVRFLDESEDALDAALTLMHRDIVPLIILYLACNYVFRLDRRVWRYATVAEVTPIVLATTAATALAGTVDLLLGRQHLRPLPLSVVLLGGIFTFIGFAGVRFGWRLLDSLWRLLATSGQLRTKTLIYGAGEAGQLMAWRLLAQREGPYRVVGFVDDDPAKRGLRIHGIEVLGSRSNLRTIVDRQQVELIILAIVNITGEKLRSIISAAQETPAQIKIVPSTFDWIGRTRGGPLVREVRIEDLLGRPPAAIDRAASKRALGNKVVMVTGASGSIGSELCRQIASFAPHRLLAVDNNESGIYDLDIELRPKYPGLKLSGVVADVTDESRMDALFSAARPQVIFHVAAYKHVPLMEEYPEEAVRVNIGGTRVVLGKARQYGAERFVLVSTDKAVNPTSVMGATKRIAEMLVMTDDGNAASDQGGSAASLKCTAVRFGNVLGSRGSVVPTFASQIEAGGPVTITHPEMTRYFMEVSEAVSLIIQATTLTRGGDIFMLDMGECVRIDDLARKMIRMRGLRPGVDIPIVYTGMRPGEKLHEELTYACEERIPTEHPLVQRVNDHSKPERARLEEEIENLLQLAAARNRDRLVPRLLALSRNGAASEAYDEGRVPVSAGAV